MADDPRETRNRKDDPITNQHRVTQETIAKSEADGPPMRMVHFGTVMPHVIGAKGQSRSSSRTK